MRQWRLGCAALALLVAGCGTGDCTTAGCTSGLSVQVDLPAGTDGLVDVEVCVRGHCARAVSADPSLAAYGVTVPVPWLRAGTGERSVRVRVTQRGHELLAGRGVTRFHELAPNGERCGPVCWIGDVHVGPGGLSGA